LVLKEVQAVLVPPGRLVVPDPQDLPVQLVVLDLAEHQETLGRLEAPDFRDLRAARAGRDLQVLQDHQDYKDLMVCRDSQES